MGYIKPTSNVPSEVIKELVQASPPKNDTINSVFGEKQGDDSAQKADVAWGTKTVAGPDGKMYRATTYNGEIVELQLM